MATTVYLKLNTVEKIQKLCRIPNGPEGAFRPPCAIKIYNSRINDNEFVDSVIKLMQVCWSENPDERPNFTQLRKTVYELNK